jgi:hypothetical protein
MAEFSKETSLSRAVSAYTSRYMSLEDDHVRFCGVRFTREEALQMFSEGLRLLGAKAGAKAPLAFSEELNNVITALCRAGGEPASADAVRGLLRDGLRLVEEAERRDPLVQRLAEDLSELDITNAEVTYEDIALALVRDRGWRQ